MHVTIFGTGYVGLVTGTCFADVGNDVLGIDVDASRIDRLNGGEVPIFEPGLAEMVARNRRAGRLRFTTDAAEGVATGEAIFIAVGTPPLPDGSSDLRYVDAVATTVGRYVTQDVVVVNKSTVPVGTADRVRGIVQGQLAERGVEVEVDVISNPEFLKEGAAIDDFMKPDRIVVGASSARGIDVMRELYHPFNRNHGRMLVMDVRSAEFTKYAANAMLATRISFMNELANLAGELGVDIEQVRRGIGADPRIGYGFLYAGVGYGGSCFPKDVQALMRTAAGHGQRLQILEAVKSVNDAQKHVLVAKVLARFGEDLRSLTFALWGLSFKPNTDDMREAPSRVMIKALVERGARVVAYDPAAMAEARHALRDDLGDSADALDRVRYADSPMQAVEGADALVLMTEWKAFKSPNFAALKGALKQPVIFDGRNLYDPAIRAQGFEYFAIGR